MTRAVLSLALVAAAGCGPSAYARHATALDTMRITLDGAAHAIEQGCAARARALPQGLEGDADAIRLRERCTAAAASHGTARTAWRAWLDALTIAVAGEEQGFLTSLLAAAVAAVQAYAEIVAELAGVGVELPPIPGSVALLTAAADGDSP